MRVRVCVCANVPWSRKKLSAQLATQVLEPSLRWKPGLQVVHWSLRLPTHISHSEEHFLQRRLSSRKNPLGHSDTHILEGERERPSVDHRPL